MEAITITCCGVATVSSKLATWIRMYDAKYEETAQPVCQRQIMIFSVIRRREMLSLSTKREQRLLRVYDRYSVDIQSATNDLSQNVVNLSLIPL